MFPGQEVAGKGLVQELARYQELDHTKPEDLDHRLQPGEGDIEKGASVIKAAFQHDGMEMRVPPQHIPEGLVGNDHSGEKRSTCRFVVELVEDMVDQSGYISEEASIVAKERAQRFG